MVATAAHFIREGLKIMKKGDTTRDFHSFFGASPEVCALCWNLMVVPDGGHYKHFLWALMQIKIYAKEKVLASLAQVDRRTYRHYAWIFLRRISALKPNIVSGGCVFTSVMLFDWTHFLCLSSLSD